MNDIRIELQAEIRTKDRTKPFSSAIVQVNAFAWNGPRCLAVEYAECLLSEYQGPLDDASILSSPLAQEAERRCRAAVAELATLALPLSA